MKLELFSLILFAGLPDISSVGLGSTRSTPSSSVLSAQLAA